MSEGKPVPQQAQQQKQSTTNTEPEPTNSKPTNNEPAPGGQTAQTQPPADPPYQQQPSNPQEQKQEASNSKDLDKLAKQLDAIDGVKIRKKQEPQQEEVTGIKLILQQIEEGKKTFKEKELEAAGIDHNGQRSISVGEHTLNRSVLYAEYYI